MEIKVSHEVPMQMLEESRNFNHYDYALVHLFEEYEEYFEFYKASLARGRQVILDNSLFELGESFNDALYEKWILILKPTYYVLPDAFNDADKSINMAKKWISKDLPGKTMAVVHGSTYQDIVKCYLAYDQMGVDKIAFNYADQVYKDYCAIPTMPSIVYSIMYSRHAIIDRMYREELINREKPHHLLGCSSPDEFNLYYGKYDFIDTIDTSHPIVCGIEGIPYKTKGVFVKPETKLADYMNAELTDAQLKRIRYNVLKFKHIMRGY